MNQDVVAEISIQGGRATGYVWTAKAGGGDIVGGRNPTATEALWRAVDKLREDDRISGRALVYSADGDHVAVVPLWCVPTYEYLPWELLHEPIDLARMARDLDSSIQGDPGVHVRKRALTQAQVADAARRIRELAMARDMAHSGSPKSVAAARAIFAANDVGHAAVEINRTAPTAILKRCVICGALTEAKCVVLGHKHPLGAVAVCPRPDCRKDHNAEQDGSPCGKR